MKHLFLFFSLVLASCFGKHNEPPGYCSELIKLSKEKLFFSAEGGIDSVIMNSNYWLASNGMGCEYIWAENESDYCRDNYCKGNSIMKIECSWFSVTQIDEYTLLVSVSKNETKEERKQSVMVDAGNCNSSFSVNQSAE
ncbi:MAG: hypothetical protein LBU89_06310 [Fibromonadaceae bacterium]|jgi:hypothetical protein|nr:hypothetical protein [Fibromonadaceae bacterium]